MGGFTREQQQLLTQLGPKAGHCSQSYAICSMVPLVGKLAKSCDKRKQNAYSGGEARFEFEPARGGSVTPRFAATIAGSAQAGAVWCDV